MTAASKRQKQRRSTIKRLEITFDLSDPRERELWERLQAVGRGKATFIKQRLVADLIGPKRREAITPDVIREILRQELGAAPVAAASSSSGLDLRPRRSAGPPKVLVASPEPALSPEDSARMLVASIRGYGRQQRGPS